VTRRERLAEYLTRNAALRVIAVTLAIGLWLFVNTGQHEAQTSLEVPVSYRRLPPGMMIINQHPDFVEVVVSGPRTLLSLLDPGRLELRLDLTGVSPGQASFRISPEMFNVPRQTSVARVSPSQIVLDIDRITTRQVRVHLNLIGATAKGYRVAEVSVRPATVTVTGPARDISRLDAIESEPFDLKSTSEAVEGEADLVIPPGPIKVSAGQVEVRVSVEEAMGEREFKTVDVQVRDPEGKYQLYTRHVAVTVHGPVLKLSRLSLDGMVYVEARDVEPGVHELPVQADLPDDMQVLRYSPDKVRLRILRAREGASS
jgi:YbbR domain-containing protein